MKEFKNKWNKEIKPYIHNPADKELAEYWWRAALGWVLGYSHGTISEVIKKELGD